MHQFTGRHRTSSPAWGRLAPALAIGAVAVAACGGSEATSTPGGRPAAAVAAEPPAAGCGSIPAPAPKDPDGVLSALPKRYQFAYRGYPNVRASAWTHWKPDHGPPYSVGIVMTGAVNQLQVDVLRALRAELERSSAIGKVTVLTTGSSLDIPQQLQQFASLLRQRPDAIIAEPLQPEAFVALEDRAGKAGIPVVNFLGDVDSVHALNINNNTFQTGAQTASVMVRMLSGKGRIMFVHGYPTVSADVLGFAGAKAVLKTCGLTFAGEAIGAYANATAKAETLKFIATHPAKLDGVINGGGMGTGIMSAFQTTGRPMPIIGDIGAQKGSISYWLSHRKEYRGVGTGQGAESLAAAVVSVTLRTLAGKGPRINTLLPPAPLITDANLDEWSDPSWKFDDLSLAPGPRDAFLSEKYLDGLFRRR